MEHELLDTQMYMKLNKYRLSVVIENNVDDSLYVGITRF